MIKTTLCGLLIAILTLNLFLNQVAAENEPDICSMEYTGLPTVDELKNLYNELISYPDGQILVSDFADEFAREVQMATDEEKLKKIRNINLVRICVLISLIKPDESADDMQFK